MATSCNGKTPFLFLFYAKMKLLQQDGNSKKNIGHPREKNLFRLFCFTMLDMVNSNL
jgi:hypothetical protein